MKQYQKEQQGVVGRDPMQGCDELTTVTFRTPVTSESQEVPVRRVGRVPEISSGVSSQRIARRWSCSHLTTG